MQDKLWEGGGGTGNLPVIKLEIKDKEQLRDLLNKSVVAKDLVKFFLQNPYTRDTIDNLANYIHRQPREVEEVIKDLLLLKVINNCGKLWGDPFWAKYTEFYSFTEDKEIQKLLENFLH